MVMPDIRPIPARRGGASRLRGLCAATLSVTLALTPLGGAVAQTARSTVSGLPNLGDSASEDLSPIVERKLGEEIMREVRAAGEDLDDAETVEYLNQFAATLTAHAPPGSPNFEFWPVKDPSINAFAMPGGFIGVNTGLLVATQTESELASVLGHEMGHVIQRHIARSISNQRQTSLIAMGAMFLALLAARSGNDQVMGAAAAGGQAYAAQSQLGFSRDAEREADRVGFQVLQESGFDVNGMVNFFGRLQQASRLYESSAPAYMRTHPLTTERIADIQNRVRDVRYHQHADNPEFNLIRARVRVLQDESVQGLRDTRALFEDQLKSGQYASEAAVHYGIALILSLQRDVVGAQRENERARKLLPRRVAMVEKLQIELRQQAGDAAGAVTLAQAARGQFPQSRMIAVTYADALQQAGRHAEAITFLRDQISLYRQEPHLYTALAKSYAATGNEMLEHKALSEGFYLRGDLHAALEQLNLARRAGKDGDFYELSQIDARVRLVQTEIRDRDKAEKEAGKHFGVAGKADGFTLTGPAPVAR